MIVINSLHLQEIVIGKIKDFLEKSQQMKKFYKEYEEKKWQTSIFDSF